jgi:hypothetical protein
MLYFGIAVRPKSHEVVPAEMMDAYRYPAGKSKPNA